MKNIIKYHILGLFLLFALNLNASNSFFTEQELFRIENENIRIYDCDSLLILYVEALTVTDSLQLVIIELQKYIQNTSKTLENNSLSFETLKFYSDSLNNALTYWMHIADTLSLAYNKMLPYNQELKSQVTDLQTKIEGQNRFLEEQKVLLMEKELIIKEKEDIYKNILTNSQIDLLKLEGKIGAKEQELQGKSREIDLLSVSISEKQKDIEKKNEELTHFVSKKELADKMIDSLRDTLYSAQKLYIRLEEENKYALKEIADLRARLAAKDKREKQVAVVQGVALRSFRTPLYVLAPKDVNNTDTYVITNDNAGKLEFDLIIGASVRIKKLTIDPEKYIFDLGWFVGFGGNNIFKNFYLGPNIKVFDFIHVNTGLNFAEFRVLKSGFDEGGALPLGVKIPTVNQWKPSFYFAITFDFELISQIVSKF